MLTFTKEILNQKLHFLCAKEGLILLDEKYSVNSKWHGLKRNFYFAENSEPYGVSLVSSLKFDE